MECFKCGVKNLDQARFCSSCGSSMAALECDNCKTSNAPGSRFCNACGHVLADQFAQKLKSSQAERRLLTVLFCDLVNSTQLVDHLDPEVTRSIIRRFQALSKMAIEQMGGRITEYLGDGIVAQFTGQETNAESAINAALKINRELERAAIETNLPDSKVMVRSGIATGLAVVGDMLGDARIRSESAIGLPLNLASRILHLAQSGEVVIGETTHQLTSGLFQFEDVGQYSLRGFEQPQKIWRVVAEQSISSRFVAHAAEMTPMVDREEVTDQLLAYWKQSKRGQAVAVVFLGEAGIGKSRIAQEFAKKISKTCIHVEYQCSPYHINTALYPLIRGVEAAARVEYTDDNSTRLRKVERLLRWSSDDYKHDTPAILHLLSISAEDKWPMPNLDPDEIKEWIFTAVINHLISLSKRKPLLIQIEDVHWIDPTTLEIMKRLVEELVGHQVFLLITSRPGFANEFTRHPHVHVFEVGKLPREYRKCLVEQVTGDSTLLDPIIDEIIERTEGIPLFIEELSKSLLERTQGDSSDSASRVLAKKDIPTSLHDSLLARLDHLPDESRSIAHIASVIGREFPYNLLKKVAQLKSNKLYELLSPLLEAQLVIQCKAPPNAEFSFRHALVRDVAYETLLQSDRINFHIKIAETIETHYAKTCQQNPGVLAHHFSEGKRYEKAVHYWLKAGQIASQKFALIESREHLQEGLRCLNLIDSDEDKFNEVKLSILISLGPVLMALEGQGTTVTQKNYSDAVDLCKLLPRSSRQFSALWGQWLVSKDFQADHGLVWANKLKKLSKRLNDTELKLQASHCKWITHFHLGHFVKAGKFIKKGLRLYDFDQHGKHASIFGGHDPKVCGEGFQAHVLWFLGDDAQSLLHAERCYQWAKEIQHKGSLFHAIELNLLLQFFRKDKQQIIKWAQKFHTISAELDLPEYEGRLEYSQGLVLTYHGESEKGLDLMIEGIEKHANIGTAEDLSLFGEILAEALLNLGRYEEGLVYIDKAIARLSSEKVQYWRAEVFRCKGELLLHQGENKAALKCFKQALKSAEKQKAKILSLRAAMSLFAFFQKTGLYPQAESLLLDVYNDFESGTYSLEQSKANALLFQA